MAESRRAYRGWLLLAVAACACCCGPEERPDDEPSPGAEAPTYTHDLTLEEWEKRVELEKLLQTRMRTDDFLFHEFHPYMSDDLQQRYLETPPPRRPARFGKDILEFQERRQLLEAYGHLLTSEELDAFYGKPTLDAAREYLLEHARTHDEERRPADD